MILCYKLFDQKALTLHQFKAHDIKAFATCKTFQSGVSLDWLLSACLWNSDNVTHFFLRGIAWADSELGHLSPVVAGQQIHNWPLYLGNLSLWSTGSSQWQVLLRYYQLHSSSYNNGGSSFGRCWPLIHPQLANGPPYVHLRLMSLLTSI